MAKFHKHRPFKRKRNYLNSSRKKIKLDYIRIKNEMRKNGDKVFFSYHMMDGEYEKFAWADIYFLDNKRKFFYNCEVESTAAAMSNDIENAVFEKAEVLLEEKTNKTSEEIHDEIFKDIFKKVNKDGMVLYEYKPNEEYLKNSAECQQKVYEQLKADGFTVMAREESKLDFKYRYGVGLHMVIDVPFLTKEIVEQKVLEFLANDRKLPTGEYRKISLDNTFSDEYRYGNNIYERITEIIQEQQATKEGGKASQ